MICQLPLCAEAAPSAYILFHRAEQNGRPISGAAPATDLRQQLLGAIDEEAMDCSVANWDGYGARAFSPAAYHLARQLAKALPSHFPVPNVSVDPDGSFSFEWDRGRRKTVILTVGNSYKIYYAAFNGEAEPHGSVPFFSNLPEEVSELIAQLYQD